MTLVSFNTGGLGSPPKRTEINRILYLIHPDIVLLQETMSLSFFAGEFLKLNHCGKCCAIDANGILGDLLLAWSPTIVDFKSSTTAGLLV